MCSLDKNFDPFKRFRNAFSLFRSILIHNSDKIVLLLTASRVLRNLVFVKISEWSQTYASFISNSYLFTYLNKESNSIVLALSGTAFLVGRSVGVEGGGVGGAKDVPMARSLPPINPIRVEGGKGGGGGGGLYP